MSTDKEIKSYYESMSLDDDQVQRIIDSGKQQRSYIRPFMGAVAASLLLVSVLMVHQQTSISERTDRTLREAAMNHQTRLELEFKSNQIAGLAEEMSLLPFNIALPESMNASHQVIGTRYCTINGKLAAHVKLFDVASNSSVSLFMTNDDDDLEKLDNTQRSVDGLDVKLWRERGLFYAMAKTPS